MGFSVLRAVMDLVEHPPAVDPYTTLKGCLVLDHQLTPVQKATKCLQVVASSNQRPSGLAPRVLPAWQGGDSILQGHLHHEVARAIQAHLAGTELTNLKELAQMADQL